MSHSRSPSLAASARAPGGAFHYSHSSPSVGMDTPSYPSSSDEVQSDQERRFGVVSQSHFPSLTSLLNPTRSGGKPETSSSAAFKPPDIVLDGSPALAGAVDQSSIMTSISSSAELFDPQVLNSASTDSSMPALEIDSSTSSASFSLPIDSADGERDGSETAGLSDQPEGGSSESSSDDECAICLGNVEDRVVLNLCLHAFCSACIRQWTSSQLTLKPFEEPDTPKKVSCPKCRSAYTAYLTNIRSDADFTEEQIDLTPKPDTSLFDSLVRSLRVLLTRPPDQFDTIPIDPSLPTYYRRLHEMAFGTPAFRSLVKQFGSRLTEDNIKEIATVIYKTLEQRHRQSRASANQRPPTGPRIPTALSVRTLPFHFPRQAAPERYQVYESALRAGGVPAPNGRRFLTCGLTSSIVSFNDLVALDNPTPVLNQPPEHNSMVMWIQDELETLMGLPHTERILHFIIREMPLVLLCCRRYVRDLPMTAPLQSQKKPIHIDLTGDADEKAPLADSKASEMSSKASALSFASGTTASVSASISSTASEPAPVTRPIAASAYISSSSAPASSSISVSSSPAVTASAPLPASQSGVKRRVVTDSTVNPFLHPSTHRLFLQFSDVLRPALARRCELFVYRLIALTVIVLRERALRDGVAAVVAPALAIGNKRPAQQSTAASTPKGDSSPTSKRARVDSTTESQTRSSASTASTTTSSAPATISLVD